MRLILTWGPTPSDLDSRVKFFDANGDEVCKLYWNNKKCDDYASLDVDVSNVRYNFRLFKIEIIEKIFDCREVILDLKLSQSKTFLMATK